MSSEQSLYERLGGYDVIAAITDDFLGRVMADERIGYYWAGDSLDTKRRDRQLIVDFLSHASGGPTFYTGRNMKTSHQGLGITTEEYDVLMVHCVASLEACGLQEAEKTDVCGFMNSLREEIVEAEIAGRAASA